MKHLSFREAERLAMETRRDGLAQVLDMQEQVNVVARRKEKPCRHRISEEDYAFILTILAGNTRPDGWTGDEVCDDVLLD